MTRTVLYPGSFDPLTNGHVDILKKSLDLADKVIVAIGVQASKTPTFSFEERVEMIEIVARTRSAPAPPAGSRSFHSRDWSSTRRASMGHRRSFAVCGTEPTWTTRCR